MPSFRRLCRSLNNPSARGSATPQEVGQWDGAGAGGGAVGLARGALCLHSSRLTASTLRPIRWAAPSLEPRPGAGRAAVPAPRAGAHLRHPLVACRAAPPVLPRRARSYVGGRRLTVLGPMPLARYLRRYRREGARGRRALPRAEWASRPDPRATCHLRRPFMVAAPGAFPPGHFLGPRHNLIRRDSSVLLGMPLRCDCRVRRRERVRH